jgi:hypothetical protein
MAGAPDPQFQGLDGSLLLLLKSFTVFSISVEQHEEEQDYVKATANRRNLYLFIEKFRDKHI